MRVYTTQLPYLAHPNYDTLAKSEKPSTTIVPGSGVPINTFLPEQAHILALPICTVHIDDLWFGITLD